VCEILGSDRPCDTEQSIDFGGDVDPSIDMLQNYMLELCYSKHDHFLTALVLSVISEFGRNN